MGGKMSRNKGQRGEREVISILQPIVEKVYKSMGLEPVKLERNLVQTRNGGFDIVGLDWIALEIKFQEVYNLKSWWKQTLEQANGEQIGVLIYRKSRVPWRVRVEGFLALGDKRVKMPVDISLNSFLVYFENKLILELKTAINGAK